MAETARSVPGLAVTMAVAMGAGPLIVYALSALSPLVIADLDLTRTQFGSLATLTFAAAGLASIRAGRVADTASARRVMLWLLIGASGAVLAASVAMNYPVLVIAVLASGVAQALSNPVTNRIAVRRVPPARRGVVMGVKQSGVRIVHAATGLFLPTLAVLAGGGGATAIAAGACLLLGSLLVARFVPREQNLSRSQSNVSGARLPAPVWWLAGFAFLAGTAMQGSNF